MTVKIPIKNHYVVSLILGFTAFGIVLIISSLLSQYVDEWEEKTLDYRFRNRKEIPVYPYISTIGIEKRSLETVGPWPWDRSLHARMVDLLSSFEVSGVNFDIFFPAPSSEAGDAQFVQAVRKAGNVVLASTFEIVDHPCFTPREYRHFLKTYPDIEAVIEPLKSRRGDNVCIDFTNMTEEQFLSVGDAAEDIIEHAEFIFSSAQDRGKFDALMRAVDYPFAVEQPEKLWYANQALLSLEPLLNAAAGVGHVVLNPDSDGVLRRVPLVIRVKDRFLPHMTLLAVMRYLQVTPENVDVIPGQRILLRGARFPETDNVIDLKIPIDERAQLRINFPPSWESFPFVDVLEVEKYAEADRAEVKALFQRHISVIGYIATGTGDMGPTPYESKFPYALAQAAIMNTILTQNFLYEVKDGATLLMTLVLLLGISLIAPKLSPLRFTLFVFFVIAGYVTTAIVLFNLYGIILKLLSPALASLILAYTVITTYWYATEERERKQLRSAFKTYVSRQMLAKILDNPESLKLTGQRKELTIMFSDIRKFSTLSDKISPEAIHRLLNMYFSRMNEIAFQYDGFVDKFIGDGLLCFFGDPIAHDDHAWRAVQAAIDMQQAVRDLAPIIRQEIEIDPIVIRIGLNTGFVIVGNMGSAERMEYTVLGSEVNLAQRLESSATPGQIMISENTYQQIKDHVDVRDMGEIQVKGFERDIKVYEVQLPFE